MISLNHLSPKPLRICRSSDHRFLVCRSPAITLFALYLSTYPLYITLLSFYYRNIPFYLLIILSTIILMSFYRTIIFSPFLEISISNPLLSHHCFNIFVSFLSQRLFHLSIIFIVTSSFASASFISFFVSQHPLHNSFFCISIHFYFIML